ncbi:MAG: phosphoribosylanthranilate isomerase [Patescibacteria group bacterium]|nr:phosphoribosylanthranilate isomerase [Patescibacteria group bacterium]
MSTTPPIRGEVKICGTTTEDDVRIAVESGADAIGIICPPKSRTRHSVSVERAVRLAKAVPDEVSTVLIPRFTEPGQIVELAKTVRPDRLQLGETEDPDVLADVVRTGVVPLVAQVVHVADRSAVERAVAFAEHADIIHLDSVGEEPGGTGHTHDWSISRNITDAIHAIGKPVILAGGLTAENVTEAIATVRPDGADVESGIKLSDGTHDPGKVAGFVRTARAAFDDLNC